MTRFRLRRSPSSRPPRVLGPPPSDADRMEAIDDHRRVLLATIGTKRDLEARSIKLEEGMRLRFYSDDVDERGDRDDLVFEGTVHLDGESGVWVAEIEWEAIQHESEATG
jgi:hypothetical protein